MSLINLDIYLFVIPMDIRPNKKIKNKKNKTWNGNSQHLPSAAHTQCIAALNSITTSYEACSNISFKNG